MDTLLMDTLTATKGKTVFISKAPDTWSTAIKALHDEIAATRPVDLKDAAGLLDVLHALDELRIWSDMRRRNGN
jgi:hypothetical protein